MQLGDVVISSSGGGLYWDGLLLPAETVSITIGEQNDMRPCCFFVNFTVIISGHALRQRVT